MDGVLIDSEIMYQKWVFNFLKQENLSYPLYSYQKKIGTTASIFDDIEKYNEGCNSLELKGKFTKYWKSQKIDYLDIFPNILIEQLEWLKKKKIKMAISSSSPMDTINEVVTTCKIESYFDCLISGRDLPESKPNPTIFLKASEQLRIPVEECLVIEDSYNGIKAGKRANMKVLAIKDKRFSQDVSLADDVIYDIKYLRQEVQVKFGI
ncbi:HAD family phosphatase [Enterococcus faecium]|nr:HAD family phosphatase [Enterococcus faecium]MDV4812248.1 HAD family phosphatase [Enterococcus faecium]